jgi:NADH dehydrogenase FAD-containing subunit
MKKRVVIVGFGDTGMLAAINLGNDVDITGISPKPCLVSGQELGLRLTQPTSWKRDYVVPFRRYKKLDNVSVHQGLVSAIDIKKQCVVFASADGSQQQLDYDVLILSPGVSNGFWRQSGIEDLNSINQNIESKASQLGSANTIAIIGGGATGVSVASNLAERSPNKPVHLFYSHSQPLPGYHPKVRDSIERHLNRSGVILHPQHRAIIPPGFNCDEITSDAIEWTTGQTAFQADVSLWAIGKMKPNNDCIPSEMLDQQGFIKTDDYLRVPGHDNIFTVGDIAASDANRSSARNGGYRLVARNIKAYLANTPEMMMKYQAPHYRWGSILGVQNDGLRVYQTDGTKFRFPSWSIRTILLPLLVRKNIYQGMRKSKLV